MGQGTFGQVVKCVNLQTGTLHAVKIIKKNQTQLYVEAQLLQIGYDPLKPSAFKITPHYKQMFRAREDIDNISLFAHSPFATPSPESVAPVDQHYNHETDQKVYGSEAANRLLQMTKHVQSNYENIVKYKRARSQVLTQIQKNKDRSNYIV